MNFNDPWSPTKDIIGKYCAELVPQKGIIGLGSGSTSAAFIKALGERFHSKHLDISCISTSKASYDLAKKCSLPLIEENMWEGFCDITFDGADVLFPDGTAIKGEGGALLREKIVAQASSKLILMADERKWNTIKKIYPNNLKNREFSDAEALRFDSEKSSLLLGIEADFSESKMSASVKEKTDSSGCLGIILPLEVLPFGIQATLSHLETQGYKAILRKNFTSDDSHWIVDIEFTQGIGSWTELDTSLKQIPGVIETGIFFKMASECIIGQKNGQIIHHIFR